MTNKMRRPIKILIMSVGPVSKNGTVSFLQKIGAEDLAVVCLPKQSEENADGYRKRGIEVFLYDEKKYINGDFEFAGFKPRNCGGVGRQGIAEATEKYGDEYICFELDDDTSSYQVRDAAKGKATTIRKKEHLESIIRQFNQFYKKTGILIGAKTGATPPAGNFRSSPKLFNNFLMDKDDPLKFKGFRALTSDDYRYGFYRNIMTGVPTISTELESITFRQNQGDRDDGNAVIYNSDFSWKKSMMLKMLVPYASVIWMKQEKNRILFREHLEYASIYPPICVTSKTGEIVGRLA